MVSISIKRDGLFPFAGELQRSEQVSDGLFKSTESQHGRAEEEGQEEQE